MEAYREVRSFFRERLLLALTSLEIRAEAATEHYLVNLLSTFIEAERARELHTPFVELLTRAYESRGSERALRMRGIGDSALFVAGFLADSMSRRGISQTYCMAVGQRAYGEASRQLFDAGPGTEVLSDLANRFSIFTRVLDEVREQTSYRTDGELLRLYERWLLSGSPELLRRLGRHGVGVLADPGSA